MYIKKKKKKKKKKKIYLLRHKSEFLKPVN
jgi:hypothetical protein